MSASHEPGQDIYRIKVEGELDERWSDWFAGLAVTTESASVGTSITTITGAVADQATLRGILTKIWDLNLTLISITRTEADAR